LSGRHDFTSLVPRRSEEVLAFVAGRGRFGLGGIGRCQ